MVVVYESRAAGRGRANWYPRWFLSERDVAATFYLLSLEVTPVVDFWAKAGPIVWIWIFV